MNFAEKMIELRRQQNLSQTAAGTAYYLQWKERQPVSASDVLSERDDGQSDGSFDISW